jgi:UDP-N-acetylmuramoyl-tripeptide--D-alanyl-D-alanine ligase
VGGSALSALTVVRVPRRHLRAYAALLPKAAVLARTRARARRLTALRIAVTGSVGKTTTERLLTVALRTAGPTVGLGTGANRAQGLAEAVGSADSSTRFIVQEVGVAGTGAGTIDEILWALEPHVSVVTTVHSDHLPGFGGLDAIGREKAKAVAVLPADGLAVLNADDPRVLAMAAAAPCRVVLAGHRAGSDVRIADAAIDLDGRLVVRLVDGGDEHTVATRLIGAHWATAVALAFAAATRLGADPASVVEALAATPPAWERLNLMASPTGARYLLDTAKATEATVRPSLAALAGVPAQRRLAVLGRLGDFLEGTDAEVAGRVSAEALAVADEVLLYGLTATVAPLETLAEPRVRAYGSIRQLAHDLSAGTGPGDLVLLLGSFPADHLSRVALRATHDVRCWRDDCTLRTTCIRCPLLGPPLH